MMAKEIFLPMTGDYEFKTMSKVINKTIQNVYGQSSSETYDLFMKAYFELFEESTKKAFPEFFEKLRLKRNQKVLEVGFGTGVNLFYYPKFIHLVGLDVTPQMLETAKRRAYDLGREDVECITYEGNKIPFNENHFDTIVETFTLCVAKNPQRTLKEMIRVCKPGGIIGIFDYKKSNSNSFILKDQKLLAETMKMVGVYYNGQSFGVFDPLFDLDALIKNSGTKVIDELKIECSFIESLGRYIIQK